MPPRLRYWLLNVPLIAALLGVFMLAAKGTEMLGWMAPAALLALAVQEPLLRRYRAWWQWLLAFALGLVVFLFVFGAVYAGGEAVGGREAGDVLGRLDAGVRFILFGLIFGGWLYPVVVIPNFVLGRWMFGPRQDRG